MLRRGKGLTFGRRQPITVARPCRICTGLPPRDARFDNTSLGDGVNRALAVRWAYPRAGRRPPRFLDRGIFGMIIPILILFGMFVTRNDGMSGRRPVQGPVRRGAYEALAEPEADPRRRTGAQREGSGLRAIPKRAGVAYPRMACGPQGAIVVRLRRLQALSASKVRMTCLAGSPGRPGALWHRRSPVQVVRPLEDAASRLARAMSPMKEGVA